MRTRRDPSLMAAVVVKLADWELVVRLSLAVLLCGLIGLERSVRNEVAGLRTHALVGGGAALFTIVSAYGFSDFAGSLRDPTRIAAQIVSGIGFLGAGAIVRQGLNVHGVTTASTLWIVAAISAVLTVLERRGVRIEGMHSDMAAEAEHVDLDLRVPAKLDFAEILGQVKLLRDVAAASASGLRPRP